jgi:hypothetical protein
LLFGENRGSNVGWIDIFDKINVGGFVVWRLI